MRSGVVGPSVRRLTDLSAQALKFEISNLESQDSSPRAARQGSGAVGPSVRRLTNQSAQALKSEISNLESEICNLQSAISRPPRPAPNPKSEILNLESRDSSPRAARL